MCEWGDILVTKLTLRKSKKESADVDRCIAPIVQALNDSNIRTVASCCGHERFVGNIVLEDGRELIITPNFDLTRKIEKSIKRLFT